MDFDTQYEFWLDTNSSDPGPEYRVDVIPNSEVIPLLKVANFASGGIKQPSCRGLRVQADASDGDETPFAKIIVPRSCMGTPSQVRVSVVGFYENPRVTDWAPGDRAVLPLGQPLTPSSRLLVTSAQVVALATTCADVTG